MSFVFYGEVTGQWIFGIGHLWEPEIKSITRSFSLSSCERRSNHCLRKSHEGIKSVNERENREIAGGRADSRTEVATTTPPPPFTYPSETDSLSTPSQGRGNKISLPSLLPQCHRVKFESS